MLRRTEADELVDAEEQAPFFGLSPSLEQLAERQGVRPVKRLDDLAGDFWPEDEGDEEFIATIRKWRQQGG